MDIQDIKAINLLREFVKEKLGGDIHKLKTFDFTTLDEDRKYGLPLWMRIGNMGQPIILRLPL